MVHIDRTTNTLDGGPDPINYADGCASFGEFCLKRLASYGNHPLFVGVFPLGQKQPLEIQIQSL